MVAVLEITLNRSQNIEVLNPVINFLPAPGVILFKDGLCCVSFLEALKRNLCEKIEKQNLDVPAMCFCGATVWDTNPDTCANNCIFYKNPKSMIVCGDDSLMIPGSWYIKSIQLAILSKCFAAVAAIIKFANLIYYCEFLRFVAKCCEFDYFYPLASK